MKLETQSQKIESDKEPKKSEYLILKIATTWVQKIFSNMKYSDLKGSILKLISTWEDKKGFKENWTGIADTVKQYQDQHAQFRDLRGKERKKRRRRVKRTLEDTMAENSNLI